MNRGRTHPCQRALRLACGAVARMDVTVLVMSDSRRVDGRTNELAQVRSSLCACSSTPLGLGTNIFLVGGCVPSPCMPRAPIWWVCAHVLGCAPSSLCVCVLPPFGVCAFSSLWMNANLRCSSRGGLVNARGGCRTVWQPLLQSLWLQKLFGQWCAQTNGIQLFFLPDWLKTLCHFKCPETKRCEARFS